MSAFLKFCFNSSHRKDRQIQEKLFGVLSNFSAGKGVLGPVPELRREHTRGGVLRRRAASHRLPPGPFHRTAARPRFPLVGETRRGLWGCYIEGLYPFPRPKQGPSHRAARAGEATLAGRRRPWQRSSRRAGEARCSRPAGVGGFPAGTGKAGLGGGGLRDLHSQPRQRRRRRSMWRSPQQTQRHLPDARAPPLSCPSSFCHAPGVPPPGGPASSRPAAQRPVPRKPRPLPGAPVPAPPGAGWGGGPCCQKLLRCHRG